MSQEMVEELNDLKEKGAQNILLTMGNKGSYFFDGTEILNELRSTAGIFK